MKYKKITKLGRLWIQAPIKDMKNRIKMQTHKKSRKTKKHRKRKSRKTKKKKHRKTKKKKHKKTKK